MRGLHVLGRMVAAVAASGALVIVGAVAPADAARPVTHQRAQLAQDTGWRVATLKDTGWRVSVKHVHRHRHGLKDTGWRVGATKDTGW